MTGPQPPRRTRPRRGSTAVSAGALAATTSPPVPPPVVRQSQSTLTDAELSARGTKHAAWAAAAAAILAALIAFGGTWWSGEKAAESASQTVAQQLSGETEKSRAEFLRGQQQEVYSKVAAQEYALTRAQDEVWININKLAPADAKAKLAVSMNTPEYLAIDRDRFRIEFVGSPPVRQCFSDLIDAHIEQQLALVDLIETRSMGERVTSKTPRVKAYLEAATEARKLREDLYNLMRADMENQ